jgi:hypothetical protein
MITQQLLREWNGKTIRQRADGYLCLTDMAAAVDKRYHNWAQLTSTASYLTTLGGSAGTPADRLIEVLVAVPNDQKGTWGHRRVAIRFAQWCSDAFAVQVDAWVEELIITGSVNRYESPIEDFEAVKTANVLGADTKRGTTYDSAFHLLSPAQQWLDQMRRQRLKLKRDYEDNKVLLAQLLIEHDCEVARGFEYSGAPKADTVRLKDEIITISVKQQGRQQTLNYNRNKMEKLFAPHHCMSVRFAANLVSPETYEVEMKQIRWTAPLLKRLGWVSIGSNWFCLDPLDPTAPPFRTILWMRERDALPTPPDANPWANRIDQAITSDLFRVSFRGLVYLDACALLDWLNKDAVVAVCAPKTVSMQMRKRGWTSHILVTDAGRQTGLWLPRYVGRTKRAREFT